MKIVIDISDNYYDACREWKTTGVATMSECIIANGTPYEEQPTGEKIIDRTYRNDPYEYMSQEPCDYCPYCKRFEKGGAKNDL